MNPQYVNKLIEQHPNTDADQFYNIFTKPRVKQITSSFVRTVPEKHVYYHRLAKEFWLITNKNFTKVFLQVRDILKLTEGIPHIIRGSAGCSLICYLMGITHIDPIHYNISLARFMHDDREDFPDIDIDFPHNRRPEIYEKIFDRWKNRVARISNHVMYKDKSSLKQAIRDFGYHKFLPKDFDLDDIFSDEDEQHEVLQRAQELKGQFKNYSLHCGGIVIFDREVPEEYRLKEFKINDFGKSGQQIKLNKDEVEANALIKIDILSNRGLSQLWDVSHQSVQDYPLDAQVFEFISGGNNIGITYAESRGMFKLFKEIKPKTIEQIACVLAIIRPAASDQKQEFIQKCEYFTDREHYDNFIIYDDDAIQFIAKLLNIDEGKADLYRKAFAKNKRGEIEKFKMHLTKTNPDANVQHIVERLSTLQDYSFCKSHAISYAQLVYALAYQKFHQPAQFWLATLNNCYSSFRKWVHYREAKGAGVKLTLGKPPWKLNSNNKLIGPNAVSKLVFPSVQDYFQYGYWINEEFLPGMYYKVENENKVKFKGLIAHHRIYNKPKNKKTQKTQTDEQVPVKKRQITFVTLGYEDGKYIDLVLWGGIGLSRAHAIEGEGTLAKDNNTEYINVTKWKFVYITHHKPANYINED